MKSNKLKLLVLLNVLFSVTSVFAQAGIKIGPIADIAWSPDGNKIAVAVGPTYCGDTDLHGIQIRDAETQNVLQTLQGHTCPILSVAWNHQGNELASGGQDSTIRIWNIEDGETRLILSQNVTFGRFSLTWSPDDTKIANAFEGGEWIELWDTRTGQLLPNLSGHTYALNSVEWSPDGTRIASGAADHTVRIWDPASGENLMTLSEHTSSVDSVSWSPDSTKIASGSGDSTVRIWDAATGESLSIFQGDNSPLFIVKWSPEGSRIAAGDLSGILRIWDAGTGQLLTAIEGNLGPITDLEWSPDGTTVAYIGRESSPTSPFQIISVPVAETQRAPIHQADRQKWSKMPSKMFTFELCSVVW
jgi:WD40 repeat protein